MQLLDLQLTAGAAESGADWYKGAFDPDTAKGWTEGQLVFRGRPLAEVVEE